MSTAGKTVRFGRFLDGSSGRGLIVPLDHGLTMGPIAGLESVRRIAGWIQQPGINGVVVHKGLAERLADRGLLHGRGLMIHLNGMHGMAADADRKERLTSVRAAVRLGADAVSLQLNFDGTNDAHNLTQLGAVVDEAQSFGLPVLTMLYDKTPATDRNRALTRQRHLMRLCIELGSDALKVGLPATSRDVAEILADLAEDVRIFFAGGALTSDAALIELTRTARVFGAAGLCVGRNVFQRPAPSPLLGQLAAALHDRAPLVEVPHIGVH